MLSELIIPTIALGAIAIALLAIAYGRGKNEHIIGIKSAANILIQIAPLLVFAFITAGLVQAIIPTETISQWVGAESGFKGVLIGSVAGGLMPGGPFISMPIAAGLLQAGANIGTMVALITGWSLWAFTRLPMEIGIMGWKFTAIRLTVTFTFPIITGLLANLIFGGLTFP
jgi:uncharacterized membrane protein YraQ (UPF0718 family)